ncbi:hypothetical protein C2G38_2225596 [Gigaspora rosea]|uniref:HMG box domain-containing protein n=1 Tax=Gigaspora rosea TaxID=44941 RepID=A0A397TZ41_9GLOM|nr:hypothetical protein C2G38_2225596 [Gigaspora rosea]
MSTLVPFHSLTLNNAFDLLDLSQIFPPPSLNDNDVQRFVSQNNRIIFKSLRNRIFRENVREEAKRNGIDIRLIKGLVQLVWRRSKPEEKHLYSQFTRQIITRFNNTLTPLPPPPPPPPPTQPLTTQSNATYVNANDFINGVYSVIDDMQDSTDAFDFSGGQLNIF